MAVSTGGVKVAATNRVSTVTLALQMALDRKRAGKELAALRENKRMTQAELVKATGLSLRQIQRYEAGDSMPGWKNLDKLGETLGPKVYDIVHDDSERPETPEHPMGVGTVLTTADVERLKRIEEKMDEILRRLIPPDEVEPLDAPESLPPDQDRPPDDEDEALGETGTEG